MSHIEIKVVNDIEYATFVKKFRLMGKSYRLHDHIGKNIPALKKSDYMRRNLEKISKMEFEIRKPILEKLDLSYSGKLLMDVEKLSIVINNLLEIKDVDEPVFTEFSKEFIFNSNNIEGSRIPPEEVRKIMEGGSSGYGNRNEVREVFNSVEAMEYLRNDLKFNISSIKRLYNILTKDLRMQSGEPYPRGFKRVRNTVNNMDTVEPEMVETKITELFESYRDKKYEEHPFKLAMDFHLEYERIHPFLDGNGRTGRMIMNKILISHGYFPIIVYSSNTTAYFNSISKAISTGRFKTYYQFMLKQARKTYDHFKSYIERY